jgi:N-dimethylarginine dimethylaminohydrolase
MKQNNVTQSVLVVPPNFFKVGYEINPFMRAGDGELNYIDEKKAMKQWNALQQVYLDLKINVLQIAPSEMHPDMVFTANQLLPFKDPKNNFETSFVLSHMATAERAGEVIFFKNWATERGYKTYQRPIGPFEGMGDAIWSSDQKTLFLGYGYRTHKDVAMELEKLTATKVVSLKLTSSYFYHLDTCFAVLDQHRCAYVKEAFDDESLKKLDQHFEVKIEIPFEEAKKSLACNLFCPDGKTIIIDQQNTETISRLTDYKFDIKTVDTSEFLKSGGSVFCLKLAF